MLRVPALVCAVAIVLPASEQPETALRLFVPDLAATVQRIGSGPFAGVASEQPASPWQACLAAANQARVAIVAGPRHGGLPTCAAVAALIAPAVEAPAATAELRVRRNESWLVAASGTAPLDVPPATPGFAGGDAVLELVPPVWCRTLPPAGAAIAARLVAHARLNLIRCELTAGAAGIAERDLLPGARLPLKPVDPAALAGLPEHPLAMVAAGLDGPVLAGFVAAAIGGDPAVAEALTEVTGVDAGALGGAMDGTVVAALLPGSPEPGWVLVLPRHPDLDAAVRARIAIQSPELAEDVWMAAGEQPVVIAWPGFGRPAVQRTANRWVLASSVAVASGMSADDASVPDLAALWPDPGTGPVALVQADLGALAANLATRWPALAGLLARPERLPELRLAVAATGDGLAVSGRNGLGALLPLAGLLPGTAPALASAYQSACRAEAQSRMTVLVGKARQFAAETSGHWPRDLDDLRAWAKTLPADAFEQAGHPDLKQPFCYVQPRVGPPGDQPVLVQDPDANGGAGSLVGFASGEVRFIPGLLHWKEAKVLAGMPETRADGADAAMWSTRPRTF